MENRKFKLLADRFEHEAGTVVYESFRHDYGLARDDTHATGIGHISVSLNPNGDYPTFTVATDNLELQ